METFVWRRRSTKNISFSYNLQLGFQNTNSITSKKLNKSWKASCILICPYQNYEIIATFSYYNLLGYTFHQSHCSCQRNLAVYRICIQECETIWISNSKTNLSQKDVFEVTIIQMQELVHTIISTNSWTSHITSTTAIYILKSNPFLHNTNFCNITLKLQFLANAYIQKLRMIDRKKIK